jgi:hypothetical protein
MEAVNGRLPFWMRDSLSPTTVLYAAGLTVLGAGLAGIAPAIKVTRGIAARLRQAAVHADRGPFASLRASLAPNPCSTPPPLLLPHRPELRARLLLPGGEEQPRTDRAVADNHYSNGYNGELWLSDGTDPIRARRRRRNTTTREPRGIDDEHERFEHEAGIERLEGRLTSPGQRRTESAAEGDLRMFLDRHPVTTPVTTRPESG